MALIPTGPQTTSVELTITTEGEGSRSTTIKSYPGADVQVDTSTREQVERIDTMAEVTTEVRRTVTKIEIVHEETITRPTTHEDYSNIRRFHS